MSTLARIARVLSASPVDPVALVAVADESIDGLYRILDTAPWSVRSDLMRAVWAVEDSLGFPDDPEHAAALENRLARVLLLATIAVRDS
ncbi:hypothetical protein [Gordonia polyisoprenivorans]|uniref:hypothetical protein n=1 Tax=Gordonia polyisoprenivorans TaxID=84595 RepID=UPI001AD7A9D4|nr:hypothetical protein [Gordonia polyisoprenivorans]QTI67659.1 hypothetical protein J6U32_19065 [Gordonia polyisoprenivorans]